MNDNIPKTDPFWCIIDSHLFTTDNVIKDEDEKTTLVFRKCSRCHQNEMLTINNHPHA